MEQRGPRKKIIYERKGVPAIPDDLEFVKNKCSDHARKIFVEIEKIYVELWFDKHYHDRHQHGDEDGKREGIDPIQVEDLVRRSLKHLLFYGSVVSGFKFINIDSSYPPCRVILQEELKGNKLNVVIEAHYLDVNNYEITVKTAMCTDDFRISVGQYCLEIEGDSSVLRRNDNKKLVVICSI